MNNERRLDELRSIDANLSRENLLIFLKALAGAASNAIKEDWSWQACILAGHLAVKEFGDA